MARRSGGAAKWRAVLKELAASGLSQVEFARQRQISVFSLRWWKWALSRQPNGTSPAAGSGTSRRPVVESGLAKGLPSFLPVTVVTEAGAQPNSPAIGPARVAEDVSLEVSLLSGRRIAVRGDFDDSLLLKLVQTLEKLP